MTNPPSPPRIVDALGEMVSELRYPILGRYILCVNLFQSSMADHSVPRECPFLHRKCLISGLQKIRANGSEPIPL